MSDYLCAYCNRPMDHRRQPSITYAQCWECWGDDIVANRDKFRKRSDALALLMVVAFFVGMLSGWLM